VSGDAPDGDGGRVPETPHGQARRMLDRAKRNAPAKRRRRPRRTASDEQSWSGAGPDDRDPTRVGESVGDLVRERNWDTTLKAAGLEARWEQIVGVELSAHCRPERLEAGELTCVAESSAWATQIRLLSGQLLARIAADLGPDVVRRIRVHGPTAPDWRHGRLRVPGRGPRDTYG
jgi:predicted nucleic acid-binding Zn ribbon protein